MKILRRFHNPQTSSDTREAPVAEHDNKIVGYAAVFSTRTDLGFCTEEIAPGAFRDSLSRKDDVRALFNHDPSLVIGRTPDTLRLWEDEKGLRYEITPPDTSLARDLVTNIRSGIVSQSSFGFIVDSEEVDKTGNKPHFIVRKATLFDVSPVTFPAYKETEVSLAREEDTGRELRERISAALYPVEAGELALELRALKLRLMRVRQFTTEFI
jgi:uncharacterized protein